LYTIDNQGVDHVDNVKDFSAGGYHIVVFFHNGDIAVYTCYSHGMLSKISDVILPENQVILEIKCGWWMTWMFTSMSFFQYYINK
jgi:hypothetical protein